MQLPNLSKNGINTYYIDHALNVSKKVTQTQKFRTLFYGLGSTVARL